MMIRIVTMGVLVLASAALADEYDLRAKLMGSWQIETASAKEASSYSFQESGYGLHITDSTGGKALMEFDCKMAQECEAKDSGKRVKVTVYFSGPKLIETETIGSKVIRRRFAVTGDGNTMEMEVIPIEPEGKPETMVFKRTATEASSKQ